MKLTDLLSSDTIISELKNTTKEGVIEEISGVIAKAYPDYDKNEISSVLLEREKLGSTGIEYGVAIPHAKLKDLDRIIIAFARSGEGIDFKAHDEKPSHLFFTLLAPDSSAGIHLKTLAQISKLLKEASVRDKLMHASDCDDIYNVIKTEEEKIAC
jgi:PTS system nitrogen regulatory IIA component